MTKFYLEKAKVPPADGERTTGQGPQGQLLASSTKEMLLDSFTCAGEMIITIKKYL